MAQYISAGSESGVRLLRIVPFVRLDLRQRAAPKMTGTEYMLTEVMEPHFFVFRKQKRYSQEKVTPMLTYYVLDGSIYQAPQLCNVFASRVGRALYHFSKAFTTAASKLEKIGYVDTDDENAALDPKAGKEIINLKEVMRVDVLVSSLQWKLPTAPSAPPFLEGYAPPLTTDAKNNNSEAQQTAGAQISQMDPIIDQGPAKRINFKSPLYYLLQYKKFLVVKTE